MAQICAEQVWKRFKLQRDRADSVGQLLVRMIPGRKAPPAEPFWALQDVSFEMRQGESLGIIGNNGSGKSTLLKLLTRTMLPTDGRISVAGRTSALIELGAGFHGDFTGRENIIISASILGISRREILRKMDAIIDFAGIPSFIDVPVKYYSSGMQARLGFALAINVEPEILIVDEVLAVGDEAFQQKCMDRIFEMKRNGVSILLVSHELGAIERLMSRALWLNKGVVAAIGSPREVIQKYRRELLGTGQAGPEEEPRLALGGLTLVLAETIVPGGGHVIPSGGSVGLVFTWENERAETVQAFARISIRRPDGLEIAEISAMKDQAVAHVTPGRSRIAVQLPALHLVSGRYEVDLTLFGLQGERLGHWPAALTLPVQSVDKLDGVIAVQHEWVDRPRDTETEEVQRGLWYRRQRVSR